MKFIVTYPDKYTGVIRDHEFCAPTLNKAKEHADSLFLRRNVTYELVTPKGEKWQRYYSNDRLTHAPWYQVESQQDQPKQPEIIYV